MVALHLLSAVVVLLGSDGALANGDVHCDFKKHGENFCYHVVTAYAENNNAIRDLGNNAFKNNKDRLSNSNSAISDFLKAESKSELFKRLHKPMHRQVNALFQMRVSCDDGRKEGLECVGALDATFKATYELAQAIAEVAEEPQQGAIKNACDKFYKDAHTEDLGKSIFELASALGTAVMSVI